MAGPHRRGPWTSHEDAHLLTLTQSHGPHNWVRISQLVGTRSPKQCRERFHQNLKPHLNHDPITPEEGIVIERLVGEMGKRWAEIARRLNGRSDNAVKNWWNGGMNRRRRLSIRQKLAATTDDKKNADSLPLPPMRERPHLPAINERAHISETLPSPLSPTHMSRSASKENTPSLTSDSVSNHSSSPQQSPSPVFVGNVLPPLAQYHYSNQQSHQPHYDFSNSRRSSMSIASLENAALAMDYSYFSRDSAKDRETPLYNYGSLYNNTSPTNEDGSYHYLRHSAPYTMETCPKSLLPKSPLDGRFMIRPCISPKTSSIRDERMHLSNILA